MKEKNPKRRKDKYDPFTIFRENGKYYVTFRDVNNIKHTIEVSKEVFNVFDDSQKEYITQLNEWDRYTEQSDLTENTLHRRSLTDVTTVEEKASIDFRNEFIRDAIEQLPLNQCRRILLYYYKGYKSSEIAEMEGCSVHSVNVALRKGKAELKNFLNNFLK